MEASAVEISLMSSAQVHLAGECLIHDPDIETGNSSIPNEFLQEQNYPNLPGSATAVQFSLAHMTFVGPGISRSADNEATRLIPHIESPGIYPGTFSAQRLTDSRDFRLLKTGDFNQAPVMADGRRRMRRAIRKGMDEHESNH